MGPKAVINLEDEEEDDTETIAIVPKKTVFRKRIVANTSTKPETVSLSSSTSGLHVEDSSDESDSHQEVFKRQALRKQTVHKFVAKSGRGIATGTSTTKLTSQGPTSGLSSYTPEVLQKLREETKAASAKAEAEINNEKYERLLEESSRQDQIIAIDASSDSDGRQGQDDQVDMELDMSEGGGFEDEQLAITSRDKYLQDELHRHEKELAIAELSSSDDEDDELEENRLVNNIIQSQAGTAHHHIVPKMHKFGTISDLSSVLSRLGAVISDLQSEKQSLTRQLSQLQNERAHIQERKSRLREDLDKAAEDLEVASAELEGKVGSKGEAEGEGLTEG